MAWSRESRHTRGYGWQWEKLRKRILARDKHLCQPCRAKGRITAAKQVDHILSKAKGGTDAEDNLQAICVPCHNDKTIAEKGHRVKPTISLDGWPIED